MVALHLEQSLHESFSEPMPGCFMDEFMIVFTFHLNRS